MSYPFNEDHIMIRDAARGWLSDWYEDGKAPERIYQSGGGIDRNAWDSFAKELGFAGISIDEKYGGAGLGRLGRTVIMEEMGASLFAAPFLSTCVIGADIIDAFADDPTKSDLLGRIAQGDLITTFFEGQDALALKDGKLSGAVRWVLDGSNADILLFTFRKDDGLKLAGFEKSTNGLSHSPVETLDPTRSFADITLYNLSLKDATFITDIDADKLQEVIILAAGALGAECVGASQKCLDITLEYTGQRVQFGRTIASFQAIKHMMADLFIDIEASRSAAYWAAACEPDEAIEAALTSKAYASDAFYKIAGQAIQLHGGIGFTWEYPLHYFFKRARANRMVFGSSQRDYERLASLIGLESAA